MSGPTVVVVGVVAVVVAYRVVVVGVCSGAVAVLAAAGSEVGRNAAGEGVVVVRRWRERGLFDYEDRWRREGYLIPEEGVRGSWGRRMRGLGDSETSETARDGVSASGSVSGSVSVLVSVLEGRRHHCAETDHYQEKDR